MDSNGGNTNDNLRKQFRSLIPLLTLVLAINSGRSPTFANNTQTHQRYVAALEENQPSCNRLLNAVTALLVRNHEVVATAVNSSSYHVLALEQPEQCPENLARGTSDAYVFVEKGTSHKDRFGDWDNLLNLSTNDPLRNHAASLEDFLKCYGSESDRSARQSLGVEFSRYIVACCWEKMYRRMTHWSSHRFVQYLRRPSEEDIQHSFNDVCVHANFKISLSTRQDSMLGGLLTGHETDDVNPVEDLIKRLCPFPEYIPDISKLVTAFNEVNTPLKGSPGWYNKATCFEFHKLLLSALISYANALRIFKLAKQSADSCVRRAALAEQLWKSGYLLWRIADSRILHHHLKLLNASCWLPHPVKPSYVPDTNELFGHVTAGGDVKIQETTDDSEKKAAEAMEVDNVSGDHGKAEEVEKKMGNEEEVEDNDDESEEFLRMPWHLAFDDRDYSTSLRWIQLQVTHWMAQDIVTSQRNISMVILRSVKISVVNVKYCPSGTDREMVPWDQLLKDLQPDFPSSVDVEAAAAVIKKAIDNRLKDPGCDPIFKKFSGTPPTYEPAGLTDNLHCEAVLASFMKYAQADGSRLGDLIQDLDRTLISVSKLCCPVCWDLLDFMRSGDNEFVVRGCSDVLSPVQLPSWLPRDILEKMVHCYKGLLVREVTIMMRPKWH